MTVVSDSHYQSTLDAVHVYVVPWSEFPIVPSYPHYPHAVHLSRHKLSRTKWTTLTFPACNSFLFAALLVSWRRAIRNRPPPLRTP